MSTTTAPPTNKWLVTGAGMSGAIAMVLSSTLANVAVPTVMGAFGVGQDQAQWLATGFVAMMVASQLLSAWFVRAFGVRGTFVMINIVFFAGTASAFLGTSFEMVVLGRILQGFSTGVVMPMVMALTISQFPPHRRGMAMAIFGTGIQIAPMLGPMIGGLVIDTVGWREMFLVPIPICVLALLLGMAYLPGREQQTLAPRFDWISYVLLVATLASLLFAGANGQRFGWGSSIILTLALLGLTTGCGFVWMQLRSAAPLLDFSLFKIPQFASAVIVAFVFGFGNFSANYLVPVTVQQVQGFTPFLSGLLLVPAGVLVILSTPIFGRLADVFPARLLVMLGLSLFATGNFFISQSSVNTTFLTLALLIVIARFGMALIIPSLDSSALRALSAEQLHRGSGALNFIRQLGGSCGVAVLVVFIERRTQFHAESMAATQTPDNSTSIELLSRVMNLLTHGGVSDNLLSPGSLYYLGKMIAAQAAARGLHDGFLLIALVFALAVIPAWNLGRARRRAGHRPG